VPDFAAAIRNDRYKLVLSQVPDCSAENVNANPPVDMTRLEFYEIDDSAPVPAPDNRDRDVLQRPGGVEGAHLEHLPRCRARRRRPYAPRGSWQTAPTGGSSHSSCAPWKRESKCGRRLLGAVISTDGGVLARPRETHPVLVR